MLPIVLFALLYSVFRLVLDALIDRRRSDASLRLELLVLRHQLRVRERQVKRPRWRSADRLTQAGLSRRLPRSTWFCFLASPKTLLSWHRDLVRRRWALFGPSSGSDAPVPSARWAAQQARQLAWPIAEGELKPRFLLRDRDAKFTRGFR